MVKAMVLVVALLGCKKPDEASELLARMDGFATAMCACKDKACVDTVSDNMIAWAKTIVRTDESEPSPEMLKRSAEIGERLSSCMNRFAVPAEKPPGVN